MSRAGSTASLGARPFGWAVQSELTKAATLPAIVLTAVGTVLAGAVQGAALASSAAAAGVAITSRTVLGEAVPFLQAGVILLGALPAAHEHAGSQIRTALTAVPRRGVLLVGKVMATLVVSAVTASATAVATLLAAAATLEGLDEPVAPAGAAATASGAVGYLVIIAMLALAVALLLRHLVPTLVAVLGVVLILSPLLATQSQHARWLPDRAAQQLYDATDNVLTPTTGALVALAWLALLTAVATARFLRRDA